MTDPVTDEPMIEELERLEAAATLVVAPWHDNDGRSPSDGCAADQGELSRGPTGAVPPCPEIPTEPKMLAVSFAPLLSELKAAREALHDCRRAMQSTRESLSNAARWEVYMHLSVASGDRIGRRGVARSRPLLP